MEKVQIGRPWYGLKKVEYDSSTGITYKWYHENYSAANGDTNGLLIKITDTTAETVTTSVIQVREGSWTSRATGW